MTRTTDPQSRPLLVAAILLALSLGLAMVLAVQSIQASRRHRSTAERALQDYAEFAAFALAPQVGRRLGDAAARTLSLSAASSPTGPRHWAAVPPEFSCPGGNSYFDEHDDGKLRVSGAQLPAADVAFLRDSLLRHAAAMNLLSEAHWRLRFVRAPAGSVDGYFIVRSAGLAGFSVCLGGGAQPDGGSSLFRQVMITERALPAALIGNTPADSLFALTVTAGHGPPLYTSPDGRPSPFHGTAIVDSALFGDLALRVDLRPEIAAQLIVGGLPGSATPITLGLLALSLGLVVTALLQLRHQHRLAEARSEFIANVSHELRTPLSQILIFTDLLRLGRLRSEAERSRSLDIIEQETHRLIRLVENVLQFARSGGSPPSLTLSAMPLDPIVRQTLDAFRPLATAREVTLSADFPPGIMIQADSHGLRQILINLLDNAVKYGPRGQTIRIGAESVNGSTRILVDDEGPGIPPGQRERIWQGHVRLPREVGSAVAGSGIGLAVVRSLVAEMRGRTWVEDTGTGGGRFVVELPAAEEQS
ncbi:MAG: HAMP domain-containing sensor histidine kinase [Gemmatimonadota bacterium]